jgi:CheY-like chemotaxis protein
MTQPTNDHAAILIAPDGVSGALRSLVEKLSSLGVVTTIVDEVPAAVEIAHAYETPPVILVDLRDVESDAPEDARLATMALQRVIEALPNVLPVAVLGQSDASTIVACIRAGAGDVIDLQLEGTTQAMNVIERVARRQRARAGEAIMLHSQRGMIEDLLKDLIRTERRSIDAEEKLAAHERLTGDIPLQLETRAPAVLLVEHDRAVADELADRLETAGIATFAYVTGEEAAREAQTLASTTGLDLALVAAQLPGMDGLATVRRLRERISGLPAFLLTSVIDADLATDAANLGVVGFVQKPLADLDEVVARLSQLAHDSLARTREHDYLQRIKERHERVLARYRALPREQ